MLRMELMCFIMMDGWATGKMMVVADDDVVVGLGWGWRGGWLAAVRMERGRATQPPIPLPVRLSQPQAWTSHKCELACLPGELSANISFGADQRATRAPISSQARLQSENNSKQTSRASGGDPLDPKQCKCSQLCKVYPQSQKKSLKDTFAAGVTPRGDALNKRKLGQVNLVFLVSLFWYCLVLNWYYRSDPKWLT